MQQSVIFKTSDKHLSNKEMRLLYEKGAKLFELMSLTPEAEKYLEYNHDLAEAIKKW